MGSLHEGADGHKEAARRLDQALAFGHVRRMMQANDALQRSRDRLWAEFELLAGYAPPPVGDEFRLQWETMASEHGHPVPPGEPLNVDAVMVNLVAELRRRAAASPPASPPEPPPAVAPSPDTQPTPDVAPPQPDGPEAGRWLWWGGKRYDVPTGVVYKLLDYMWRRTHATYDDLEAEVFPSPYQPDSIRNKATDVNGVLKGASVPWRLSCDSKSRTVTRRDHRKRF